MKKLIKKCLLFPTLSLLLGGAVLLQGCTLEPVAGKRADPLQPTTLSLYGVTVGGKVDFPLCAFDDLDSDVDEEVLCIIDRKETMDEVINMGTQHMFVLKYPLNEVPKEWGGQVAMLTISDEGIITGFTFIIRGISVQDELQALITQKLGFEPDLYRKLMPNGEVLDENGVPDRSELSTMISNRYQPNSIHAEWNTFEKGRVRALDSGEKSLIRVVLRGNAKGASGNYYMGTVGVLLVKY